MYELNVAEVSEVAGGLSPAEGAAATIGLMALCVTPLVIGVGCAALITYAFM